MVRSVVPCWPVLRAPSVLLLLTSLFDSVAARTISTEIMSKGKVMSFSSSGDPIATTAPTTSSEQLQCKNLPEYPTCNPAVEQSQILNGILTEASGIAVSRKFPGNMYVVNDTPKGPEVYLVDINNGSTTTITLNGISKDPFGRTGWGDTETMAYAPCDGGEDIDDKMCYFIGDTGHNCVRSIKKEKGCPYTRTKPQSVIRFQEPEEIKEGTSVQAERFPFVFPDQGQFDVEALFHHGGHLWLLTKEDEGKTRGFRFPKLNSGGQTGSGCDAHPEMTVILEFEFSLNEGVWKSMRDEYTAWVQNYNAALVVGKPKMELETWENGTISLAKVTGAVSVHEALVVRTYDGLVWMPWPSDKVVPEWDKACPITDPTVEKREAVSFFDNKIYILSEKENNPVQSIYTMECTHA